MQFSRDNVPGMSRVVAIPSADFLRTVYNYLTDQNTVEVTSLDNIVAFDVFDNNTFKFDEKQSLTEIGNVYDVNVTGVIPTQSASPDIIKTLENNTWLVVIVDSNGDCRLVGTQLVPLRFASNRTTSGINGNAFTMACQQEKPTLLVNQTLLCLDS